MKYKILSKLFLIFLAISISLIIGCAGYVYSPKNGVGYHPVELINADKAITDAQKAGKDKQCPKEFAEAKGLRDKAWEVYWSCRTKEAIAIAKDSISKTNALCPPPPPPPPAPAPKIIDKMTLLLHFDFDKAIIKDIDIPQLKKAVEFVKKYPQSKVSLEGHTDSIGTEKYNQKLSEKRAEAVKKYLIKEGACLESKISSIGYGELKPVDTNKNKEGRANNRRVEVLILSE